MREVIDTVYFLPRTDIYRVFFVATPHRGSKLALNPAALLAYPPGASEDRRDIFC